MKLERCSVDGTAWEKEASDGCPACVLRARLQHLEEEMARTARQVVEQAGRLKKLEEGT